MCSLTFELFLAVKRTKPNKVNSAILLCVVVCCLGGELRQRRQCAAVELHRLGMGKTLRPTAAHLSIYIHLYLYISVYIQSYYVYLYNGIYVI